MSSPNVDVNGDNSEKPQESIIQSSEIANILSSKGPVVTCVLLKATPSDTANSSGGKDEANNSKGILNGNVQDTNDKAGRILKDQIEEIKVDTTPSKNMVSKILGGSSFTFLGQYEDEGVVLMVQRLPVDLASHDFIDLKASELRALCKERDISTEQMLEKSDLVRALEDWSKRSDPPINRHRLQPPLHKARVRGDILVLKVAETNEELDNDEDGDHSDAGSSIDVLSNDDFFLDYSLDEYVKFASRTDIAEYEVISERDEKDGHDQWTELEVNSDSDEEVVEQDEVTGDEAYRLGEEDVIDDEDKAAMFNLVMNEVLRQYREENGRGPDTKELLEMRSTIAKELDVPVAHIDADQADWNRRADGTPAKEMPKTIGFRDEDKILEYEPHPNEHAVEEYDMDGEEGFAEAENESSDDEDEPPRKRIKANGGNEEEDSKPAAKESITEDSPLTSSASSTGDAGHKQVDESRI